MDTIISELTAILGKPSTREKNKFGKPVLSWQKNDRRPGFEISFGPESVAYDIWDSSGYGTIGAYCEEDQICMVAQKVQANVNPLTIVCS